MQPSTKTLKSYASKNREQGSVLIWAVLIIAILSLIGAEVVRTTSIKYQNILQTTQWQEALLAAESGIDLGIVELRKALYPASYSYVPFPTPATSPNPGLWDGWPTTSGTSGGHETVTFNDTGLAGTGMTVEVMVDAPSQLLDSTNPWTAANPNPTLLPGQYYRIRSIGTVPLTGPARATDNKQDSILRKFSLVRERFTNNVLQSRDFAAWETPHVSRRLEVIVKPSSTFDLAILSRSALDLRDHNIVIDSYDSRDPNKSTNGLYDVTKQQQHGNIATDGTIINAGNAQVFGDAMTNNGTVTGIANITGIERDDFYQDIIPVATPTGFPATTTSITTPTTLTATGTQASPTRYTISNIQLNGNDVLRLSGASGTYMELYVTGDISITGNQLASIVVDPGVKVKIYFAGNVSIGGRGMVNTTNVPGDLQLFGIQPSDGSTPSVLSLINI